MVKKYVHKFQLLLLCGYVGFSATCGYAEENILQIKNSVIKVYITAVVPDNEAPWQSSTPVQITGSGVVISGNRILTNAHVVADAKYIQVQKNNDPNKYVAQVSFVSHYADLALLKVSDPFFFKDVKPMPIGKLPNPYQEVTVLGYPMGGDTLSITKGVLSRIEQRTYAHEGSTLLAGQIDAAINPGNSGGPVVVNSKMIGIVMQVMASEDAENLGYFIPPSVIQHVLADSENGKHNGFPELGFRTQNLENPAAKVVFGLNEKNQYGVLVVKVFEGSAADKKLQKNDVILKIDNYNISGNSTIKFSDNLKLDYKQAIDLHHVGDKVDITYSRAGKIQKTTLIAKSSDKRYELLAPPEYDKMPRYYIYGGVVFIPLTASLFQYSDRGISVGTGAELWETPAKKELVAILEVLPANVNFGYHNAKLWVVDYINGQPIKDFLQFAQLLKNNTAKNVIFENENGYQIIINHQEAMKSESDIFKLYKIPNRYSAGLFDNTHLN